MYVKKCLFECSSKLQDTNIHATYMADACAYFPYVALSHLFLNMLIGLKYSNFFSMYSFSPGGGNGYPLQYSSLGNSMNREVWQATVHGVTKSQTQLGNHTHTPFIGNFHDSFLLDLFSMTDQFNIVLPMNNLFM